MARCSFQFFQCHCGFPRSPIRLRLGPFLAVLQLGRSLGFIGLGRQFCFPSAIPPRWHIRGRDVSSQAPATVVFPRYKMHQCYASVALAQVFACNQVVNKSVLAIPNLFSATCHPNSIFVQRILATSAFLAKCLTVVVRTSFEASIKHLIAIAVITFLKPDTFIEDLAQLTQISPTRVQWFLGRSRSPDAPTLCKAASLPDSFLCPQVQ